MQTYTRTGAILAHGPTTKEPPANCEACGCTMSNRTVFFDCKIPQIGSWGNICLACFQSYGCKTGTGRGQKYEEGHDGVFYKTIG